MVILLPEDDGKTGVVTVGEGADAVVLDAPLATARVNDAGKITKEVSTKAAVKNIFGPALSAEPPKPKKVTLYFETGSTQVTTGSRADLEAILAEAVARQAVEVEVTGHTDTVGTTEDNDRLSLDRATAVRNMLIQRGVTTNFIRAVGRGERDLLVPTADNTQNPRNRRVEIIVR